MGEAGGESRTKASQRYILTGLLKCPCGRIMKLFDGPNGSYYCNSFRPGLGCKSNARIHRASLEQHVLALIGSTLSDERYISEVCSLFMEQLAVALTHEKENATLAEAEHAAFLAEQAAHQKALKNLYELVKNVGASDHLVEEIRETTSRLDAIQACIQTQARSGVFADGR